MTSSFVPGRADGQKFQWRRRSPLCVIIASTSLSLPRVTTGRGGCPELPGYANPTSSLLLPLVDPFLVVWMEEGPKAGPLARHPTRPQPPQTSSPSSLKSMGSFFFLSFGCFAWPNFVRLFVSFVKSYGIGESWDAVNSDFLVIFLFSKRVLVDAYRVGNRKAFNKGESV